MFCQSSIVKWQYMLSPTAAATDELDLDNITMSNLVLN